jgi:hypothetical protein
MTWVVWRQHRAEGLIVLVMLAGISVFLLLTGLGLANSFQQLGQNHCLELNSKGGPCAVLEQAFFNHYVFVQVGALVLLALQLLLGALVGAPLVTREMEQHTHLLAWTQSITRTRWLSVKLALVLGVGLLASGALLAGLSWWHDPWAQYEGSFGTSIYDTSGPVWVVTTGLALALGIFAGALTRRTVAAIFLTIALFVAIRAPVEFLWRPHFETPVTVTYSVDQPNPPALSNQDWIISQGFVDAQGNRSTNFRGNCTSGETLTQCLQANSIQAQYITYQPASRFWTFQWIETGIYLGFSLLALCATFWLVRRRLI